MSIPPTEQRGIGNRDSRRRDSFFRYPPRKGVHISKFKSIALFFFSSSIPVYRYSFSVWSFQFPVLLKLLSQIGQLFYSRSLAIYKLYFILSTFFLQYAKSSDGRLADLTPWSPLRRNKEAHFAKRVYYLLFRSEGKISSSF